MFGMDTSKNEQKQIDSKPVTKIPPTPKLLLNKNSVETTNSKIPKRDVLAKPTKPNSVRKPSSSMMNLNIPKTTSLPSSRSCLNSHRSAANSKEQTPRHESSEKMLDLKKKNERAAINRNLQAFEKVKEALQNCQEQFMNKFALVKNDLPKEEKEYKMVCLIKNNEGHLIAKNQTSKLIIKLNCDHKTLEHLKASCRRFAKDLLDILDQLKKSPINIGDTNENLELIQEAKIKLLLEKKPFLDDILQQIESLQVCDKSKDSSQNKELDIKIKTLSDEVENQRKLLEESQAESNKIKKSFDQKLGSFKKELDEKNKNLVKQSNELDELKKLNETLEKENIKAKTTCGEIREKLVKKTFEWEESCKKLENNIYVASKNKDLEAEIDGLKNELNIALNLRKDSDKDKISEVTNEIIALKNELVKTKKEKEVVEGDRRSLKNEIFKLQQIDTKCQELQNQVNQANEEKQRLAENLRDLEAKLLTSQNEASASKDIHEEFKRLKTIESEKNANIKTLEQDLVKTKFQVKQLEEKITMDSKLLRIRTELIDSLQRKEHTQKIRLTDLFAEVGEKKNDLQLIKSEILTKTEEFQNLFSTLSSKQMELTRQEHMIKLLQENNERAQQLRVRQEAKIGRLEDEIVALKHTIAIYQDAVIPNNSLVRKLAMAEAANCRESDETDSLGFYVEERRKKRHIDISVKKYEK